MDKQDKQQHDGPERDTAVQDTTTAHGAMNPQDKPGKPQELETSATQQNQTTSDKPVTTNRSGAGSHATGTQNTRQNENIGGRNPGQKTVSGDQDKSQSRSDDITDPMSSRDPSINQNLKGA